MHVAAGASPPPQPPAAGVHKRATVSPGGIVGIVLGLLALVAIAIAVGAWLWHRRKRQEAVHQPLDAEERWAPP